MAEERTISTITWLNSRLRTCQSVTTLVEQTQIRQWHRYNKEVDISCALIKLCWPKYVALEGIQSFKPTET